MQISEDALDIIVGFEVTDRATYNKKYTHTEWPGGASGVTIGIGYDVGQDDVIGLRTVWAGQIPGEMIKALERACGVVGPPAKALSAELYSKVTIPWETAIKVFVDKDIPRYELQTRKGLPNCDLLSPDSFGALVSLVYNRGPSFSNAGDRYEEMRNIKEHMRAKTFHLIPDEIRGMRRLWGQGLGGLLRRRDMEADLFKFGLGKKPIPPPVATIPVPPPTPPPAPRSFWQSVIDYLFGKKR